MTDILIPKKNIILDATLLTGVMTCGRFADLRYNHSFVQLSGKSNSLECGSIVHKAMEVYYDSIAKGFHKSLAIGNGLAAAELYIKGCPYCSEFVPSHHSVEPTDEHEHVCNEFCVLKPECGHPINEFPGVKNTPPDSDSSSYTIGWRWVLHTIEEYFDYYKNDYWVPIETEVVKRKILFEDDEIRVMWKAKLDLTVDTNQGIYPADHKTMKQRRDSLSLNNQFIGQCLMMETRNVIINKIGFQTSLSPDKKFTRDLVSYSADRLIEWQSEILPYWAYQLLQYSESGFWPVNMTNCEGKFGKCVFTGVCEADRGMREEVLKLNFYVGQSWDPGGLDD